MSSLFNQVSDDAFLGASKKGARIPDGSGGRSISEYYAVDGSFSIPAGYVAYVVMAPSCAIPVKVFTTKDTNDVLETAKNGFNETVNLLTQKLTTNPVSTREFRDEVGYELKELHWRTPISAFDLSLASRKRRSNEDWQQFSQVSLNNAETMFEDETIEPYNDETGTYSLMQGFDHQCHTHLTHSKQIGECPTRWRAVAVSGKIQPLSVPEYMAGWWQSCDFFPKVNTQNLSLFVNSSDVIPCMVDVWNATTKLTTNPENCYVTASNILTFRNNTHWDPKMLNELFLDLPYYSEKPSYNEGSFESLKAVQFNLQRKHSDRTWIEGGIEYSGTATVNDRKHQKRIYGEKFFSKLSVQKKTGQLEYDRLHSSGNISANTDPNDKITLERFNLDDVGQYAGKHIQHNNNRLYGGSVTSSVPFAFSCAGLESNSVYAKTFESSMDDNLSTKIIVLHNGSQHAFEYRIAVGGVFEFTPDNDAPNASNSRPVLKEDAFALKQEWRLGNSASRRKSRFT